MARTGGFCLHAATEANGDALTLGVQPHDLGLVQEGGLSGSGEMVERMGNETIINVLTPPGAQLVAALDGDVATEIGAPVTLGFAPEKAFLFEADGRALAATAP